MAMQKSFEEEHGELMVTSWSASRIYKHLGIWLPKTIDITSGISVEHQMGLNNILDDEHEEHTVKAWSLFPVDKNFSSLLPGTNPTDRFDGQLRLKKGFGEFDEQIVQLTGILPYEVVVFEIFTRVSLGTLLRQCQWVCRRWHKLIHESNFQLIHSQRTSIASGCFFFIEHRDWNIPDSVMFLPLNNDLSSPPQLSPCLKFLPPHLKILGSSPCGSLLCFVTLNKLQTSQSIPIFYICKPATREWRQIPNPRTRFRNLGVRILVTQTYPMLQYKIVRFSIRRGRFGYHCEIFDSRTWVWKRLADVAPLCGFGDMFGGVYINGYSHWISKKLQIHVLSIEQEIWTTALQLPPDIIEHERYIGYLLVLIDGKMGVMISNLEYMELWVLQNYYSPSTLNNWKREYRKDLRPLNGEVGLCDPLAVLPDGTIILVKGGDNSCGISYNTNNDTYTILPFPEDAEAAEVFPFESRFCYF